MAKRTTNTELLIRIDERVAQLTKNMDETVLPAVTKTLPTMQERLKNLRTIVFSLVALLGFIQTVVALWQ